MGAALLGDLAVFRIRCTPRLQVCHHNALVRHDGEKHIARHDRRGERPKVQQRRTARKNAGVEIGHGDKDYVKPDHQPGVVIAEFAFADKVIGQPAKGQ